ncbi:MAG: hypothetical protein MUE85_12095 [Microscillaceae bacterium]|nr:hypothetical protein [Microscillaceae bacterium]
MKAQWNPAGATTAQNITRSGNVGIGTSAAPGSARLIIQSPATHLTMGQFRTIETTAARSVQIGRFNATTDLFTHSMHLGIGSSTSTTPNIPYWTNNDPLGKLMIGTDGSPTMLIDGMSNGRLGINTLTPQEKLDVNGQVRWGTARGLLKTEHGASLELGGSGTPYLDFSNDATTDFDVRLALDGDDMLNIKGGKVRIGDYTTAPTAAGFAGYQLFVKEGIRTEKVKVDLPTGIWADYVFKPDYKLRPLSEVEAFIKTNQHLPDVPSEKELQEKGLDLGEMHKIQMQKIEELTLYLLELKKQNEDLQKQLKEIKQKINQQQNEEN